jgi:lysophospholipase L1-like esterase
MGRRLTIGALLLIGLASWRMVAEVGPAGRAESAVPENNPGQAEVASNNGKAGPLQLHDGERIVLLGGTLIEREQRWGYWETALVAAHSHLRLRVRNLGWSGDTVTGESRGRFEFANPNYRLRQIVEQTLALQPTVILLHYGGNEAYAGPAGLADFEKGLEKLLDALQPSKARMVLLTPQAQRPFAGFDPSSINAHRRQYGQSIRKIATRRGLICVDLYPLLEQAEAAAARWPNSPEPVNEYGLHLTATGYRLTAGWVVSQLLGREVPQLNWTELEPLRQAVVTKNTLFFHRWRPQNETYLFGFRKHEQGKNAQEVAALDPLIEQAENRIDELRRQWKRR